MFYISFHKMEHSTEKDALILVLRKSLEELAETHKKSRRYVEELEELRDRCTEFMPIVDIDGFDNTLTIIAASPSLYFHVVFDKVHKLEVNYHPFQQNKEGIRLGIWFNTDVADPTLDTLDILINLAIVECQGNEENRRFEVLMRNPLRCVDFHRLPVLMYRQYKKTLEEWIELFHTTHPDKLYTVHC